MHLQRYEFILSEALYCTHILVNMRKNAISCKIKQIFPL